MWPPAAKAAVGCGSGCAVLVLLQVVGLWGILNAVFSAPPSGFAASVQAPPAVTAGKEFPLTLTVRNQGTEPLTVSSLLLKSTRLELTGPEPAPTESSDLFGSTTWVYSKTVEPGGKWSVRFKAKAKGAGEISESLVIQTGLTPNRAPIRMKVGAAPR